uniref:Cilia and flagella associated protein 92 (putative) n=1 Tax=Strigops habroptila TaxID=2489341 RepID=A0A672U2P3_STRHB
MAEQKQENSEAAEEGEAEEDGKAEMTNVNTLCSESTLQTEHPEMLGGDGPLIPERESCRFLQSEESSGRLDSSHTVTSTLTVSLALPAPPAGQYLTQDKNANHPDTRGKRLSLGAVPRMEYRYQIEYFLLPDDLIPRKADLVVSGVTMTLWFENNKMWISWNLSVDISVTNEYLLKLRDHKIILKIWDAKENVSSKARPSKAHITATIEEDAEEVGESNVKHRVLLQRKLFEESQPAPSCMKIKAAKEESAVAPAVISEQEQGLGRETNEEDSIFPKPRIQACRVAFLLPWKTIICAMKYIPHILSTGKTDWSVKLKVKREKRLCVPTYCKYKFHNFPPHRTHEQIHGTHVYFKDVNVLLTGTMKPGELETYLRGPPLEIEVHDRDRNMETITKKPALFGENDADENVGKVSFLACKPTAYNYRLKNEMWHPHGVAKIGLTDLLLGKKYLNVSAPIRNCSVPNTDASSEEDKNGKVTGSVSNSFSLPMGDYLESDSVLKVRVEIAVPLGTHAEIADTQVTSCPYGCIIYIFDYNNSSLLHDLVEEIKEINTKALQLDDWPVHLIGMALAALKLKTTLEKVSKLDIVTGFHLLDGATHLFVLEGLKDKAIKKLWDRHFERTYKPEDGRLEILYNSQLAFPQRLYTDLEVIFYHFRLYEPLFTIAKDSLLYVRGVVPQACFQALSRYDFSLCRSKRLRDVIHGDLLPSAEMITALSLEYGVPLTDEDLFTQTPPLPTFPPDDYTVPGKVSRVKQAVTSSVDNYNEAYIQWKKEIPKFEAFMISPVDGKSVFNYSCQSLNSAELAKKHLRQEMAKEPKNRFTYCQDYLSATFEPVDVVAACKEFFAKSKSMWQSPDGFVFPGYKSSIESNLHPQMPHEARQEELRENVLHANMEPVLPRDRWSWDKRHIDFDLYKKPPELIMTTAPQTGNGSVQMS